MLSTMESPPQVLLTKQWKDGKWQEDHKWADLMPKPKAALIVEAFDLEDLGRFLILGDWMEDNGEDPEETQRFRNGNWHDQDYSHATLTLFWRVVQEFKTCPSVKVFIRLLQANWKHEKFLAWYSKAFDHSQTMMYEMMKDPKKHFDPLYGAGMRKRVKEHHWRNSKRYTEEEFRNICDHAKEVCYYFRAKEDLEAWSELWKDRFFYIERPLKSWERAWRSAVQSSST